MIELKYGGEGGIRTLVGGFQDPQNGLANRLNCASLFPHNHLEPTRASP